MKAFIDWLKSQGYSEVGGDATVETLGFNEYILSDNGSEKVVTIGEGLYGKEGAYTNFYFGKHKGRLVGHGSFPSEHSDD